MSPLGATWRCDECRKLVRGRRHTTTLGRTICDACQGRHESAVLGGLMAQNQPGAFLPNAVGDTIAVAGARSWFRRATGRNRAPRDNGKRSEATQSTELQTGMGRDD